MNREAISDIVLDVVRSRMTGFASELSLDTPLGAEGAGLDSLGFFDVVMEVERRTGIGLRNESLTAESLATPRSLVEYLMAHAPNLHG